VLSLTINVVIVGAIFMNYFRIYLRFIFVSALLCCCFQSIASEKSGQQYPEYIVCQTSSNGLRFVDESLNMSVARESVKSQCMSNRSTDNNECILNISCNGNSYPAPSYALCSTESNGLRFVDENINVSVARENAKSSCMSNRQTDNNECILNMSCSGGSYPAPALALCSTSSNGLRFVDENINVSVARESVKSSCISNRQTDNNECILNISCSGGGNYPTPPNYPPIPPSHPPIPPSRSCVANRYDPAGMFIQNYESRDCGSAMSQCNSEIRGRQYCSLGR
jgi:predicted chitinase